MTTPAQQSLYQAINEYVAAFVERHGSCQATRDEAHEIIAGYSKAAVEAVRLAREYRAHEHIQDAAEEIAHSLLNVAWVSDELELTCHMIAVEMEKES